MYNSSFFIKLCVNVHLLEIYCLKVLIEVMRVKSIKGRIRYVGVGSNSSDEVYILKKMS